MKILKQSYLVRMYIIFWLILPMAIFWLGWQRIWSYLKIPTLSPSFADMRVIQASIEAVSLGLNPQVSNPTDPWGRPMNYPYVWSQLAKLIKMNNEKIFIALCCIIIFAFLCCCYKILQQYPSMAMLTLLLSGSTLLAIERANNDLIIFVILYFAIKSQIKTKILLVGLAGFLKVYALSLFTTLVRSNKTLAFCVVTLIPVSVYLAPQLPKILSATPSSPALSYGSKSIALALDSVGLQVSSLFVSLALIALVVLAQGLSSTGKYLIEIEDSYKDRMFLFGSVIYVSSFLVLSNWDYRLIFCLFCVPAISSLQHKSVRNITLTFLILAMNQPILSVFPFQIGILINSASKVMLFLFLCASLMPYFKKLITGFSIR